MKGIILTALLVFFNVNAAQAACDTKSLKGSYQIAATGILNGKTCGTVGVGNFDGKGVLTTTSVDGCGGQPANSNGTYSYNVNANCMCSATSAATGNNYYFVFNKLLTVGSVFLSGSNMLIFGTMIKQ